MFIRIPDELDHCPACGHVGLELDNQEYYEGTLTVRCVCPSCEYTFVDVYKYSHSTE